MIQASRKKGPEADKLYQEAEQKLKDALVINPNDARAFLLWYFDFSCRPMTKKMQSFSHY
jgi:hypothetical protein